MEAARQLPKALGTPFRLIFPLWKIKLLMLIILENVNLKLRKSTDEVKNDLLNLQLDTSKFDQLKQMKISDMSLREFTELIIYKNLVQINQQVTQYK